jgi:hypothetical protein
VQFGITHLQVEKNPGSPGKVRLLLFRYFCSKNFASVNKIDRLSAIWYLPLESGEKSTFLFLSHKRLSATNLISSNGTKVVNFSPPLMTLI